MIVDASAIIAILHDEADAARYAQAIAQADVCRISAATFVEAAIVIEAQAGPNGGRQFDTFVRRSGLRIEAVDEAQARIARQAYLDFGKGRHSAGLNYGDLFSYALSKASGEPLLFKGDDFSRTDIVSAL